MAYRRQSFCVFAGLLVVAACSQPPNYDLRSSFGGFSTATAARTAIEKRPEVDARGIISYPNYQVAVARNGDTTETVAQRLGINAQELADYNSIDPATPLQDGEIIALPYRLDEIPSDQSGQVDLSALTTGALNRQSNTQRDPNAEPIRHKVVHGETAYTISRLYNIPVGTIADWNGLGPDYEVREGQVLLIPVHNDPRSGEITTQNLSDSLTLPGERSPVPTPPSAARPLPDENLVATGTPTETPQINVGTPTSRSGTMAMPLDGNIIRTFQKGKNDGIDITGPPGSPIKAAGDGTVAKVTSQTDQTHIVIIRHPDNILSIYANVDDISVQENDAVSRGQAIAKLRSDEESYLHFEIRRGVDAVDPIEFLR
ncbi:MAG: peptidoglycan DD-metalloendopeptidase family protein [Aestuariivita sp.]|nr:peptidoglycan DD-metalloendopeptidase family protein [Aestuariivita sp.]